MSKKIKYVIGKLDKNTENSLKKTVAYWDKMAEKLGIRVIG